MGKHNDLFVTETPMGPHLQSRNVAGSWPWLNTVSINDELQKTLAGACYLDINIMRSTFDETLNDITTRNKPHNHDWEEYVMFVGTDPADPMALGAEVEMWLDDEPYMITKTTALFVPKLVYHLPMYVRSLQKPFVWITTGTTLRYSHLSFSPSPRWQQLEENNDLGLFAPVPEKKMVWVDIDK